MQIEPIAQENLAQALALVERVFMQFEAPDYLPEGTMTFRAFLHDPEAVALLVFYGAYVEDQLVGVLATRGNSHIALFFVEPCFQRQGVGRALFHTAREACLLNEMTVNASPYAIEIYKRLGFHALSDEQLKDGIRFTPMKYVRERKPDVC
jgi:GNAT superfamily N-acetyltransferase